MQKMYGSVIPCGMERNCGRFFEKPAMPRAPAHGAFFKKTETIQMKKTPFVTLEKAREIAAQIPTPFHLYD